MRTNDYRRIRSSRVTDLSNHEVLAGFPMSYRIELRTYGNSRWYRHRNSFYLYVNDRRVAVYEHMFTSQQVIECVESKARRDAYEARTSVIYAMPPGRDRYRAMAKEHGQTDAQIDASFAAVDNGEFDSLRDRLIAKVEKQREEIEQYEISKGGSWI